MSGKKLCGSCGLYKRPTNYDGRLITAKNAPISSMLLREPQISVGAEVCRSCLVKVASHLQSCMELTVSTSRPLVQQEGLLPGFPWQLVFRQLDDYDLGRVGRVCRQFYRVSSRPELWMDRLRVRFPRTFDRSLKNSNGGTRPRASSASFSWRSLYCTAANKETKPVHSELDFNTLRASIENTAQCTCRVKGTVKMLNDGELFFRAIIDYSCSHTSSCSMGLTSLRWKEKVLCKFHFNSKGTCYLRVRRIVKGSWARGRKKIRYSVSGKQLRKQGTRIELPLDEVQYVGHAVGLSYGQQSFGSALTGAVLRLRENSVAAPTQKLKQNAL